MAGAARQPVRPGPGRSPHPDLAVCVDLKRHRWRILGFCAAAVILTVIISARLTPIFESTTTVDVDRETPAGVVGQDAARSVTNDADQFLATQMKLVQSDGVLRPVDGRFSCGCGRSNPPPNRRAEKPLPSY